MPTVDRVRKEPSPSSTHQHIAEVCTIDNYRYTRAQVIASIDAGHQWQTFGGGRYARIETIRFCPAAGCYESPYIRTVSDSYAPDNLDKLPAC